MESLRGKKVFVGLSGGVDSAVSAALLQKTGANVTSVFIKGWYPPGMPCTWADDRRDAMRVAATLGIPFHTLEAADEYKKGVIDYLLAEYAAGRTPNPDVMCNREVKFGAFFNFAKKHHADFIATGHYARTKEVAGKNKYTQLLRGLDSAKDQSYFLWAIPQEALSHTLFPVGELPKSDVRTLAKKFNLPVAEKKDSQGICFLGSISVDDFLREEFGTTPGKAVTIDENGEIKKIGTHDGAVLYTLGTRIALQNATEPGPWYVVAKDMSSNVLTISKELHVPQEIKSISLRETNLFEKFLTDSPNKPFEIASQYRYHGPIIKGSMDFEKNVFTPHDSFAEPVASGQSLVLYSGEECVGGGIIV